MRGWQQGDGYKYMNNSKSKEGKDQESIQSSTTPDEKVIFRKTWIQELNLKAQRKKCRLLKSSAAKNCLTLLTH